MARAYVLRKICDPTNGKLISNAVCEAYDADATTATETQYSVDGVASFSALPDTDPVHVKISYGNICYWIRDLFQSAGVSNLDWDTCWTDAVIPMLQPQRVETFPVHR